MPRGKGMRVPDMHGSERQKWGPALSLLVLTGLFSQRTTAVFWDSFLHGNTWMPACVFGVGGTEG